MGLTTLTLSTTGRLNATNLGGTPTASTNIYINSGVVGIIPYKASIVCNKFSCMGASAGVQGKIGVPNGADYTSIINTKGVSTLRFCAVGKLERVNSGTITAKGGGAF